MTPDVFATHPPMKAYQKTEYYQSLLLISILILQAESALT